MATITKVKGKNGVSFRARVRRDGVSESKTFDTREEARRWGTQKDSAVDCGDYVGKDDSHRTTLGEAMETYLEEVTPFKRGKRQEERRIKAFIENNPALCARKLASLRGQDFSQYKRSRLADGKASNTVRIELSLLSQVFVHSIDEHGMDSLSNPLKNVKKPPGSQARERRFTPDELANINSHLSPPMRIIVEFALLTAMRRGEICKMKWEDIISYEGKIKNVLGRNGLIRDVLMLPRTVAILSALPRPITGGVVFGYHPDTLTYQFDQACKKANVSGACFHTLRHEAATRFVESGLDMKECMRMTGHSAPTMLLRYYHPDDEKIFAKLEATVLYGCMTNQMV